MSACLGRVYWRSFRRIRSAGIDGVWHHVLYLEHNVNEHINAILALHTRSRGPLRLGCWAIVSLDKRSGDIFGLITLIGSIHR